MVKGQTLERAFELSSSPLSPVAFLWSLGLSVLSSILPLSSSDCLLPSSANPLGSEKFPSSSFGGCSCPKGVVSPVSKRSQELEGVSFLRLPQNNPSGVSSLVRSLSVEFGPAQLEDFHIEGISFSKLASIKSVL